MFKFVRRAKQEQVQEPSLRELCDAVAAHPDSVIVAVFDTNDFVGDVDPAAIDHEYLQAAIYRLVMEAAA
jgi:hypothetical protein